METVDDLRERLSNLRWYSLWKTKRSAWGGAGGTTGHAEARANGSFFPLMPCDAPGSPVSWGLSSAKAV